MISYDRYTELLTEVINRTITAAEQTDVAKFEAAQPKSCPKCKSALRELGLNDDVKVD